MTNENLDEGYVTLDDQPMTILGDDVLGESASDEMMDELNTANESNQADWSYDRVKCYNSYEYYQDAVSIQYDEAGEQVFAYEDPADHYRTEFSDDELEYLLKSVKVGKRIDGQYQMLVQEDVIVQIKGDVKGAIWGNVEGDIHGDVRASIRGNIVSTWFTARLNVGAITKDIIANIRGNISGNIDGRVYGDIKGGVTGDITGVQGKVTGRLSGTDEVAVYHFDK